MSAAILLSRVMFCSGGFWVGFGVLVSSQASPEGPCPLSASGMHVLRAVEGFLLPVRGFVLALEGFQGLDDFPASELASRLSLAGIHGFCGRQVVRLRHQASILSLLYMTNRKASCGRRLPRW